MDPIVARKTWRTVEPLHGLVYFAQERDEVYDGLGLRREQGYFVSRSAAMGAVPAEVVIATFFNFHPAFVRRAMDAGVWTVTTPAAALDARLVVVDRMLRRVLADLVGSEQMKEAATLARRAAERACERPEGRPLFAGHASLEWPDARESHLVLWHAQTLLREFRGDAHIAAMTAENVSGCEALVLHAGTGEIAGGALRSSRNWPKDEWAACVEGLQTRGWIDTERKLTDAGRVHRQWVEDRTDALSVYAYEALSEDGCERLRQLCRPMSQAVVANGELGFREAAS